MGKLPNCWFVKVNHVNQVGIPDFLMCIAGAFVALELKGSETSKISPMQIYTIDQIIKSKGIALITFPNNWKEIYEGLAKLSLYGEELAKEIPN